MNRQWHRLPRGMGVAFRDLRPNRGARPFVILFVPRTGSNLLAGMLDTHPQILCHHELFLPTSSPHRSLSVREGAIDLDLGTAEQRDADPIAFLKRVYSLDAGASAVGFKLALSDPNVDIVLGLILNRAVRKIVMRRDNWLQVYTSALIAEETRSLIEFEGERSRNGERPPVRVPVDVARFRRYVQKRRSAYALLHRLAGLTGQTFFDLEYRAIKDGARMKALLEFLGVSPDVELRERTVKQNPARLEERIANFDEVRRKLAGTRYEAYLNT